MGLTIHYNISTDLNFTAIRSRLGVIHQKAKSLPFSSVGKIVRYGHDGSQWMDFSCRKWIIGSNIPIEPIDAIGFDITVGDGSEMLGIFLAKYPKTVKNKHDTKPQHRIRTNLKNWMGHGFCKTQYASDPAYGGIVNFLKCHISVIHLLEFVQSVPGFTVQIDDEGRYGSAEYTDDPSSKEPVYYIHSPQHDVAKLAAEVGEWNEMVAAAFGNLNLTTLFVGNTKVNGAH